MSIKNNFVLNRWGCIKYAMESFEYGCDLDSFVIINLKPQSVSVRHAHVRIYLLSPSGFCRTLWLEHLLKDQIKTDGVSIHNFVNIL